MFREIPFHNVIYFETDTNSFVNCTETEYLRYFKGVFKNKERFMSRFMNERWSIYHEYKFEEHCPEDAPVVTALLKRLEENFDSVEPFSFTEAFAIENREFKALVFSSINIPEMVKELGAERIKTDGIEIDQKIYDYDGKYLRTEKLTNVYEVYEVKGEKIGVVEPVYCVKCWDTTSNEEKFIWIDSKFKDDPLSAVSSTFHVHEEIIPFIKCLKRQGDVLICEMTEDVKIKDIDKKVPLTMKQYFGLLVAQA
jgi:hypothetical protein